MAWIEKGGRILWMLEEAVGPVWLLSTKDPGK
jgi:hypothetical protein